MSRAWRDLADDPPVKHLTMVGECILRHTGDELHVDHADPIVHAGAEFLDDVMRWRRDDAPIRLEPPFNPGPVFREGDRHELVGRLLRIDAANRTVVYRLTSYEAGPDWYRAEWPD